jgi:Tfp pilus assembly protein PilN
MSALDVDFLPPSWRARREVRRSFLSRVGAFTVVLLLIAGAQTWIVHQRLELDRKLQEVEIEHARARNRIAEVEELDRKKNELATRLDLLKDVLKRARGAEVVAAAGRAASPRGLALDSIKFVVTEGDGVPELEMTVSGTCLSHDEAVAFTDALAQSGALDSARLVHSEETAVPELKEFVVTAHATGLLEAPPHDSTRARTGDGR